MSSIFDWAAENCVWLFSGAAVCVAAVYAAPVIAASAVVVKTVTVIGAVCAAGGVLGLAQSVANSRAEISTLRNDIAQHNQASQQHGNALAQQLAQAQNNLNANLGIVQAQGVQHAANQAAAIGQVQQQNIALQRQVAQAENNISAGVNVVQAQGVRNEANRVATANQQNIAIGQVGLQVTAAETNITARVNAVLAQGVTNEANRVATATQQNNALRNITNTTHHTHTVVSELGGFFAPAARPPEPVSTATNSNTSQGAPRV